MNTYCSGRTREGDILFQLKSIPISNLPQAHFIYGVLKAFSIPTKKSVRASEDVLFPLQGISSFCMQGNYPSIAYSVSRINGLTILSDPGIYFLKTGELTLVTTPSPQYRVFLLAPLSSTPSGSSASVATLAGSGHNHSSHSDTSNGGGRGSAEETRGRALLSIDMASSAEALQGGGRVVSEPSTKAVLSRTLMDEISQLPQRVSRLIEGMDVLQMVRFVAPNLVSSIESARRLTAMSVESSMRAADLDSDFQTMFPQFESSNAGRVPVAVRGDPLLDKVAGDRRRLDSSLSSASAESEPPTPVPKTAQHQHHPSSNHSSGTPQRKRAIPSEVFKAVFALPNTNVQRFPVDGDSGLELLLTGSEGGRKELGTVGGFGYQTLSAAFKNFQQSNGFSHSWMGNLKCSFALRGGVSQHEERDFPVEVVNGTGSSGGEEVYAAARTEREWEKSLPKKKKPEPPPVLRELRRLVARVSYHVT